VIHASLAPGHHESRRDSLRSTCNRALDVMEFIRIIAILLDKLRWLAKLPSRLISTSEKVDASVSAGVLMGELSPGEAHE